jgi:fatty acid synthase
VLLKDQYAIELNVLSGISDLTTISPHSTLTELGLDSMTAAEIEESLEREFEVCLKPQEVRSLTFANLKKIFAARLESKVEKQVSQDMKV